VFRLTLRQWRTIPQARRAVAADFDPAFEDGDSDPAGEKSSRVRADWAAEEKVSGYEVAGIQHMRMGLCSIWLQRVDRMTSDLLDGENVGGGEEQIFVCHVRRHPRPWRGAEDQSNIPAAASP
jgi:hypothetical protein